MNNSNFLDYFEARPYLPLAIEANRLRGLGWCALLGSGTAAIGFADDHDEPNSHHFPDFWQAQERAKLAVGRQGGAAGAKLLKVSLAAETYLDRLQPPTLGAP